jgi:hypothetical protein
MSKPDIKPYQFQKGNPGGPGRSSNWLKPGELKTVVGKFMKMDRTELTTKLKSPQTTMLELIVGQIIFAAAKSGDANKFEMLLNRTIGRIRDELVYDDEGKPMALIHRPDGSTFEVIPLRPEEQPPVEPPASN